MSTSTKEQIEWYRKHNNEFQTDRDELEAKISEHLEAAFKDMSELEDLLNTGMKNAGHDTYALTRNDLNGKRVEIRSMARQFGMRGTSYPLRLIGGDYSSLKE